MIYQTNTRRRRWPWVLAAVAGAVLVTGVGALIGVAVAERQGSGGAGDYPAVAAQPAPTGASAPVEPAERDPYEVWLERAPADAPEMTPDDALARAYLGCGQNWPPGTTDAILQEVYADYVDC